MTCDTDLILRMASPKQKSLQLKKEHQLLLKNVLITQSITNHFEN